MKTSVNPTKWGACILLSFLFLFGCQKEVLLEDQMTQSEVEAQINLTPDMTEAAFQQAQSMLELPLEPSSPVPTLQGWEQDRTYALTYQPYATITIGGVAYNNSNEQWLAGQTVGGVYISPSDFQAMLENATQLVRMQIGNNPYPWWPGFLWRSIRMTQLDQGNYVAEGLFTYENKYYQFVGSGGAAGGNIGNTGCGAISLGAAWGNFSSNFQSLTGYLENGFIAGCWPVAISASVRFYYSGTQI